MSWSKASSHPMSRMATTMSAFIAVSALMLASACNPSSDDSGTESIWRPSAQATKQLPLGADGLEENLEIREVQPGVTLTRIKRGDPTSLYEWTIEISIPDGQILTDPDALPSIIKDEASAEEAVAKLQAAGIHARAEEVTIDPVADYSSVPFGWRVRVGTFADEADALIVLSDVQNTGMEGSLSYLGHDAGTGSGSKGPWRIDVLTIDPAEFDGTLTASFGPDIERRETPSKIAELSGANVAINAGFFMLDPSAGAPGDPAGVLVVDGELLSEPVKGRPALVISTDARDTKIMRLEWEAALSAADTTVPVSGINRMPGLIRNCGGSEGDAPTSEPRHDITCTNDDEIVVFTDVYGTRTPKGAGAEMVLDANGSVITTRDSRGSTVPEGGTVIQGIGDMSLVVQDLAEEGDQVEFQAKLMDDDGTIFEPDKHTSVLNGGPELVRNGERHITVATDGMVHPDNESFYYGWVHKRNPRTIAGIDAEGRLVIATAAGRSVNALGLSIPEAADLAIALGLQSAFNFDGGGSTAMVVDGDLLTDPSDVLGERPVGDVLLVLPGANASRRSAP